MGSGALLPSLGQCWQKESGGLQVGWDEPFTQHPTIPMNSLGHPSRSSLLVPFMLGASKGCRAGVAGQHSEGQLLRIPGQLTMPKSSCIFCISSTMREFSAFISMTSSRSPWHKALT